MIPPKRIAVIGTGTVGILSLAHMLTYLPDNFTVHSIYDPKIPIFGIGESTAVRQIETFWEGADFNLLEHAGELDATVKIGTRFVNWREHDIWSPVQPPSYGMHLNNFKIKDVFYPRFQKKFKDRFVIQETEVKSLTNRNECVEIETSDGIHSFDYVVDCRGWPESYDDYTVLDTLPLNHCLVQMIKEPGDWNYTYHKATKNGWMFGIPLQTRQGWGYLYNDTITTKEEALEDMAKVMDKKIEDLTPKEFTFKNFYANKFLDGRIMVNGNRAAFLEPLEGFTGGFYTQINRLMVDFIFANMTEKEVNKYLIDSAKRIEIIVCFFYHGGSIFDSKFWNKAKQKTGDHLKNSKLWKEMVNEINSYDRIGKLRAMVTPFSVQLWQNRDKDFGYNYFTPKD
jgi:hypothetical protein